MAKSTTPATEIITDISASARFTSEGLCAWPKLPQRSKLQAACPPELKTKAADLLAKFDESRAFLEANPLDLLAGYLRNTFGLEAVDLHNRINAIDRAEYDRHTAQLRESTQELIALASKIFRACEPGIHADLVAEVQEVEGRSKRLNIAISTEEYCESNYITVYFAHRDPALAALHQARWALNMFAAKAEGEQPRIYSENQFVEAVRYCATEQPSVDPM
jgi:hypothetical protein